MGDLGHIRFAFGAEYLLTAPSCRPDARWFAMVSMFIVGSVVAGAFAFALVTAAVLDRRRSIRVVSDPARFAAQAVNPKLPWA